MGVLYRGSKMLRINEVDKEVQVSFLEVTPDVVVTKEYVNHHILLADVSGSMSSNIRTLRDRIKTTLEALLHIPNSYVSIITYSSHNESKAILSSIKCDQTTFLMNKVFDVIDKELYTKGVTVMSEPLEQSIKICKSLAGIADKHHICLFTDGCLVPWNWSTDEEEKKCFAVAEICKKENIFLNAIGFGQYYDKNFLKKLIDIAGNGSLIHIDSVSDYATTILETIKKVNAEHVVSTNFKSHEGKVFVFTNSSINNENSDVVLFGNKNIVALINGESYSVNGSHMIVNSRQSPDEQIVEDFYYSLARHYLKEEDIDNYEFIIMMLGDTALFNETQNCYSFIEKGNAVNKVTVAYEDRNKRFVGGKKPIVYSLENEPLCALEILKMILEDDGSSLYWDLNTPYTRITQASKSIEDNIKFKRQEKGLVPVTSVSVGSEKLNVGIKVGIPGIVTDEISGISREAKIFRDYNLLNSGNVNVPFLNAKLSESITDKLMAEGILETNLQYTFDGGAIIYKVDLTKIKSANKRLLKSMTPNQLIDNLRALEDLKCRQWALNKLIKEVLGDKNKVEFLNNLSLEEIEIRKLLRIDENGIYQPLKTEKDEDQKIEIYPAIHMEWSVKFPEKKAKELHLNHYRSLFDRIIVGDINTYEVLKGILDKTRQDIRRLEYSINVVRISSAMIGKSPIIWTTGYLKDKKVTDKILQRNMVVSGQVTVNEKISDEKEAIMSETKWVQLIKCS